MTNAIMISGWILSGILLVILIVSIIMKKKDKPLSKQAIHDFRVQVREGYSQVKKDSETLRVDLFELLTSTDKLLEKLEK